MGGTAGCGVQAAMAIDIREDLSLIHIYNEHQREKMSHEFYVALKKEIETYQERASHLINTCLLYTSTTVNALPMAAIIPAST